LARARWISALDTRAAESDGLAFASRLMQTATTRMFVVAVSDTLTATMPHPSPTGLDTVTLVRGAE
jgi:hypothetical protein